MFMKIIFKMFKMVKDIKSGLKPFLLKLGIALALSFAGFLYSHLKSRKMQRSLPSPPTSPGGSKKFPSLPLEGLRIVHATTFCNAAAVSPRSYPVTPRICEITSHNNPGAGLSPRNDHSDEERVVFLDFNELVKDIEVSSTHFDADAHMRKAKEKEASQEIANLRNMVQTLREREMKLKTELVNYYGLKEKETTVMELENRLKINSVEAQVFNLKIESLQADKERMDAQVADYLKVKTDLESAKAKIKFLKRKIKSIAEESKEQMSALQEKVQALQDQEHINPRNKTDFESKLKRLKELEKESVELKRANSLLQCENSELASSLSSTQLASSVLEVDELHEANNKLRIQTDNLRLQNDNLVKEIEQLRANHCSSVEELVYLRWVNACLRFERRNQEVTPGKTAAKDLSKSLSPRSEAKAKQLILEYSNLEGLGEKGISLMDIDSDYWSSTRTSIFTDSTEYNDSSSVNTSSSKTSSSRTSKLYSKLKRLVHKKDHHNANDRPRKRESLSTSSSSSYKKDLNSGNDSPRKREFVSRSSSLSDIYATELDTPSYRRGNSFALPRSTPKGFEDKLSEQTKKNKSRSQSLTRQSLDDQKLASLRLDELREVEKDRRKSDVGYFIKGTVLSEEEDYNGLQDYNGLPPNINSLQKLKLIKFAEALKESHGSSESQRK